MLDAHYPSHFLIQVSKAELKERIELYLKEVNSDPVPFRWKYGMESAIQ